MKNSVFSNSRRWFEERFTHRYLLPQLPVLVRLDFKNFSSYTRSLPKPYSEQLAQIIHHCTQYLVESTQAKIGYTQSDEITLVYYYDTREQMLYGGKEFKYISIVTAKLIKSFLFYLPQYLPEKLPQSVDDSVECDCRLFQVPTKTEAVLQLIEREQDAVRNSISKAAQTYFSHDELQHKNSSQMQDMLIQKGINWNDYPVWFKRGIYFQRAIRELCYTRSELANLPLNHDAHLNPDLKVLRSVVQQLDLPPLRQVINADEVIFDGAIPQKE